MYVVFCANLLILYLEVIIMRIDSEENILSVLSSYNPWWRSATVPKELTRHVKRFAYHEAMTALSHQDIRRMAIISGARRIGKTTMLYQLIQEILRQGVDPRKILYVSFDHPLLKLAPINRILDAYRTNIYGDNDIYCFFDELQYVADWDAWLKVIYDTQPNTCVVATGSASPVLVDKAGESGVGRWKVISVPTLSFYEYCDILGLPERPALGTALRPTNLIELDHRDQVHLITRLQPLQKHFHRYLQVGVFPELALSHDDLYAQRVLREDVVDKVLKRDIPSLFAVRNPADLERIFLYLCYHSSSIISVESIARELNGVSRPTVEKYIDYLRTANLIYVSPPVNVAGKKALKVQNKIYIADAAIRNAVLMQQDILINPIEMGIMVETAVYKHVQAFYYQEATQVGYYRESGKTDKEIDVVVQTPRARILIEVKYRESYDLDRSQAIVKHAPDASRALVITKKDDDYGPVASAPDKIYRIPAYAFLYLLGHAEKANFLRASSPQIAPE